MHASNATSTRDTWRQARRTGIGSTDAVAILGLSPYRTAYQVWADKRGLLPEEEIDSEPAYWGRRLQETILDAYRERSGRDAVPWSDTELVRHRTNPWLLCTPDGLQTVDGVDGLVEIKTAAAWKFGDWKDEPPLAYQVQLQHALMVTGYPHGTLVVLLGGQRMLWFDCDRNVQFQAALLERLHAFWGHVQSGEPPPVDNTVATAKVLAKLHPKDSGDVVTLPQEAAAWDIGLTEAKARVKELEAVVRSCENRLKAAIGDATYGVLPSGEAYSWRTLHRSGYTVEDCDYRMLRRVNDLKQELERREPTHDEDAK